MKKYLVLWLIVSLLFPYFAFAYELSVKDSSIVESATAKIEKIIATRGESIRNQVIALLRKATVTYNSNARMKTIIEKTIENIQVKDLSLGNLFGEENTTIVQPQPPYQKHEETRENRNIVTVPTVKSENKPELFGDVRTSTNTTPQPVNIPPTIKSCYIQNGEGQEMNGICAVTSCNSGYTNTNNSCLQNKTTSPCSLDQHIENYSCTSNTKSCSITNGLGEQIWNSLSYVYDICNIKSCNSGYENKNGMCSPILTCSGETHNEGNICVGNMKYSGCDTVDITLSNGQTWAMCNVGSSVAGIEVSSYGNYYQNGKNDTEWTAGWGVGIPGPSQWGLGGQGPCTSGYHVPTNTEWQNTFDNLGQNLPSILKLPMAGGLSFLNGSLSGQGLYGSYWSSSPYNTFNYNLVLNGTGVHPNSYAPRSDGNSVRCIKN